MTTQTTALQASAKIIAAPGQHGMAHGTQVMTADGVLPVEHLAAGDRIITRDGLRTLVGVSAHVVTGEMIRVGVNSLGNARPDDDVLLGKDAALLIRDWRAMALYGTKQAVIPVSRMVDGELIRTEAVSGQRMYTLAFAAPAVIYAGGLEVVCPVGEQVAA